MTSPRNPYLGGMPKTPKQYVRALLVKLGLFNETAFRYAIDAIYPDDVFLVSYPKSGNTWLRFMLAQALNPEQGIHFRNVDETVPDLYLRPDAANKVRRPRFMKCHDAWFEKFPRCIYIVRDYRDVFVSYFHYQQSLGAFRGDMNLFADQIDTLHPFGSWADHVSKAFAFAEKFPERILMLRYEDMLLDPAKQWQRISQWSGISTSLDFEELMRRSSFASLREKESQHGSLFMDKSGQHFFREGKSGGWKKELPDDVLQKILAQKNVRQMLQKLNYNL